MSSTGRALAVELPGASAWVGCLDTQHRLRAAMTSDPGAARACPEAQWGTVWERAGVSCAFSDVCSGRRCLENTCQRLRELSARAKVDAFPSGSIRTRPLQTHLQASAAVHGSALGAPGLRC